MINNKTRSDLLLVSNIYGLAGKKSTYSAGDTGDVGLIPGLGRFPGVGNGNPVQYSCLKIQWTEEQYIYSLNVLLTLE